MEKRKKALLVKGSIFVKGRCDEGLDGDKVVAWVSEGQVDMGEAIVMEGDVVIDGDLCTRGYDVYATENITCMKKGEY